jgi:Glycosyltransferase sugar-binding region containing DXD motif
MSRVPYVSPSLSIPQRLVFTYRYNFFDEPLPLEGRLTDSFKATYNNVLSTIRIYISSFNGNAEVVFLDNKRCRRIIDETYPKLTRYFDNERGKFKSDICRISELYLRGGYYFDVDLETLSPFKIPNDVSFATVQTE